MALVFGYPYSSLSNVFAPSRAFQFSHDPLFQLMNAPRSRGCQVSKVRVEQDENSKGWIVKVSLPGIRSNEHIKLRLGNNNEVLKIVAQDGYHNHSHNIALPEGTDLENISAQFENQVLTVSIPTLKQEEKEEEQEREIQVKKTEAQRLQEEETKKKQEEKEKKLALFWKRLSGPKATSSESETHNIIKLDFGEDGIDKENVDIEVLGNQLTVSVKVQEEQFQYKFQRTIALPDNVKEHQISASFEGTSLVISFPKEEVKKPFKIAIVDSNTTSITESEAAPVAIANDNTSNTETEPALVESKTESIPESEVASNETKEQESKAEPEILIESLKSNFVEITDGEEN